MTPQAELDRLLHLDRTDECSEHFRPFFFDGCRRGYRQCLNDRRHAATNYTEYDTRIRTACRKLHLAFPF